MTEKIRYEIKKKRMTGKFQPPPEGFVRIFMGDGAWPRLMRFEEGKRKKGRVHDGKR